MKRLAIFLLIALPLVVAGQEDYVMLKGRVTSGGKGVPYATLQLMGTSTGVSCNGDGKVLLGDVLDRAFYFDSVFHFRSLLTLLIVRLNLRM